MNNNELHPKPTPTRPNIAVLIDAENINNISAINDVIRQLEQDGNIVFKRAIGDWNRNIKAVREGMRQIGIDIVQQTNLAIGHNSADIRLVIEAIDILHNPHFNIDTFAILSSDQDFLALYQRLRELGKTVIVAAKSSPKRSRIERHSDRFIPINTTLEAKVEVAYNRTLRTKNGGLRVSRRKMNKKNRSDTRQLILRAMNASTNDQGVVPAQKLYKTMRRLKPDFSVKKLGYSTFAKLIRSYPDIVKVRGRHAANISIKSIRPT